MSYEWVAVHRVRRVRQHGDNLDVGTEADIRCIGDGRREAIERGMELTLSAGAIVAFGEMLDWPGHTVVLLGGDLVVDVWESPGEVSRWLVENGGKRAARDVPPNH